MDSNGSTKPASGRPNGHHDSPSHPNTNPSQIDAAAKSNPPRPRGPRRPNYALIHARKLPLDIYALPAFQPHNPLSLLPYLYTLLRDFILPRSSHAQCPYHATFSSTTRSVHVTDPRTVRALWESGFFGKGTLSRSEPNWLEGEKRRLGMLGRETAEENSIKRRKEREEFKRERARIEREMVEEVRRREERGEKGLPGGEAADQIPVIAGTKAREVMEQRAAAAKKSATSNRDADTAATPAAEPSTEEIQITNQEHLQLTLEEAFFLTYALGSLHISNTGLPPPSSSKEPTTWQLLNLFRRHSYFPPLPPSQPTQPDDHFLLSYITYHHFRSLGWVVRPGLKFAVDFLLYERGVVFSHAAFAVLIIPSYTHAYWFETGERKAKVERERKRRNWHWFHAANRVQNQVLKTLVVVYVDVPPPLPVVEGEGDGEGDVGMLLKRYKVREFCVKRWSPNRNRE